MASVSSQEFNRNPTSVKRKADDAPVYITEHGEVAYVVVNIKDYHRLQGVQRPDLVTYLQSDDGDDYELPEVTMDISAAQF